MSDVESPHVRTDRGFVSIEFDSEAGETAERLIDSLKTYCVGITDSDGDTEDYILWGCVESLTSAHGSTYRPLVSRSSWSSRERGDGHLGQPVKVQRCGPESEPVGEMFTLDAVRILVY